MGAWALADHGRRGRHVHLLPLDAQRLSEVHRLVNDREASAQWRTGGRLVPADALERLLTTDVALSRVAYTDVHGPPAGLLELSASDLTHGHGHVSVLVSPPYQLTGFAAEAVILFLDECFARLGLRLVYFLLSGVATSRAASGLGRLIEVCGILPEHARISGELVDVTIGRVTRDRFTELVIRDPLLGRLAPDGWLTDGQVVAG